MHEIVYEDLVKDPLRVGAAVARHCGLTWNRQAIEIHTNASVSLTTSAAQIRRPITVRPLDGGVTIARILNHLSARCASVAFLFRPTHSRYMPHYPASAPRAAAASDRAAR
jgi:hypothetical protein